VHPTDHRGDVEVSDRGSPSPPKGTQMSVRHRVSRLLAAGAAGIALLLPLGVVSSSPAQATNGTCNGASTRYNGIPGVYAWIPLKSGDKGCWMGQGHGTTAAQKKAVRALQNNILDCYGSTWA